MVQASKPGQKPKSEFSKLRSDYRLTEKGMEKRIRYRDSEKDSKKWWTEKSHKEKVIIYLWILRNNHSFSKWKGSPLELAYTEMMQSWRF